MPEGGTKQSRIQASVSNTAIFTVTEQRAETVLRGSEFKSHLLKFAAIHHLVRGVISFIQMMDNWRWEKNALIGL